MSDAELLANEVLKMLAWQDECEYLHKQKKYGKDVDGEHLARVSDFKKKSEEKVQRMCYDIINAWGDK